MATKDDEDLKLAKDQIEQITAERDTAINAFNKLAEEVTFRNKVTAMQLAVGFKNESSSTDDLITIATRIHTFITS